VVPISPPPSSLSRSTSLSLRSTAPPKLRCSSCHRDVNSAGALSQFPFPPLDSYPRSPSAPLLTREALENRLKAVDETNVALRQQLADNEQISIALADTLASVLARVQKLEEQAVTAASGIKAVTLLVEQHYERFKEMGRWVRRRLKPDGEAEEVVTETSSEGMAATAPGSKRGREEVVHLEVRFFSPFPALLFCRDRADEDGRTPRANGVFYYTGGC
jgi:hypothetical protein